MIDSATANLVAVLTESGVSGVPCDEWQVSDLEQQLRIDLPAAYKAFLLVAGQGFSPFEGSHYAVEDDISDLQRSGGQIFKRHGNNLPTGAFVFFVHQGFAVRFFLLDDGFDPAVYEYAEQWPPIRLSGRFSDFVREEVRQSGSRR
jgi:SMI1 / KNR4 family (SUKH-1)